MLPHYLDWATYQKEDEDGDDLVKDIEKAMEDAAQKADNADERYHPEFAVLLVLLKLLPLPKHTAAPQPADAEQVYTEERRKYCFQLMSRGNCTNTFNALTEKYKVYLHFISVFELKNDFISVLTLYSVVRF